MKLAVAAATIAATIASAQLTSSVPHNLLWPKPYKFTSGTQNRTIDPASVQFKIVGGDTELLTKAAARFAANALAQGCASTNSSSTKADIALVTLTVAGEGEGDESFELDTAADAVAIAARHSLGALRALETLAQLVAPLARLPPHAKRDAAGCARAAAAGIAPRLPHSDHPAYAWRGVSLDTSRNFIPVDAIERTLDGMAATKLNVLHWHIVDATSFPVESKTYPDLINAAYDKLSVYSYSDVKSVIAYAADRGIRVIPEFDTPAHTNALSASKELNPFVLCANAAEGWVNPYNGNKGDQDDGSWWPFCPEPPCGAINVADKGAAPAVSKLLLEYASLFPDSVFHLGGDEVSSFCFASQEKYLSLAFPGMKNYSSIFPNATDPFTFPQQWYTGGFTRVYQDYIDLLLAAMTAAKKQTMHWEDLVLNDFVILPPKSIIQIWNGWDNKAGKNSLQKVLDLNRYQIVDTNNEVYYLDGGSGKWLTDSFGYGNASWKESYWTGYRNWQHIYNHDPRKSPMENTTDTTGSGLASPPKGDLNSILGAEVAIWGEKIDVFNLDVKLWPRAAAMAEALWSTFEDPANKDFFEAQPRLVVMRDRLISRGLDAEALHPTWCDYNQCGFMVKGNKSPYGNKANQTVRAKPAAAEKAVSSSGNVVNAWVSLVMGCLFLFL
ncbi:glycoside hydrolase superfamily [Obelidium mucronatum]|nr:glycoside hydrolase superfamily [Obelidium mucronatum]